MAPTQGPALERVPIAQVEEARDRQVAIAGIEGTLSEYEVQSTMNKRARLSELAECQAARMDEVPLLAGEIQVAIHVLRDGTVSEASPRSSTLGDIETERCVLDVVRAAKFPRPRGGEADVTWSIAFDVHGRSPAHQIAPGRIKRQLAKRGPPLRTTCELSSGTVRVTAYVGRSGRVLSVGASAHEPTQDELFECISEDVKTWRMPRGDRVAKVSFDLP